MIRYRLSLLLLVGFAWLLTTAVDAQTDKTQVKRIVVVDPAKAKELPDFLVQGEYLDKSSSPALAAQVVALGKGKFDVYLLQGGLPGEGWDGKAKKKLTAETVSDQVTIKGESTGKISGGILELSTEGGTVRKLSRVERTSPTLGAKPPAEAIVLFDGNQVDEWSNAKIIELSDGKVLSNGIDSKRKFNSFKAHIEFRLPFMPDDRGQGRSNSGFYLQNRYEIQILDSFGLKGENNECGGLYTVASPSVNMCFPPLTWQTYDIDYTAAVYEGNQKVKDAVVTVTHNGVKIHDNVSIPKPTGGQEAKHSPNPGAIHLQSHGNLVYFRNIWVVEKK